MSSTKTGAGIPGAAGSAPASAAYRRDIDGLRAIAVLSVLGFHLFPRLVPGGFIGVDVFFVISGYLITGIILREQDDGDFTLRAFYARRVRRIFPALALVLLTCLVAGWIILFPQDYATMGHEIAAAAAFVANLDLWLHAGYFARAAELKPTLHLWSLGVEEQFYLLWPLALMAVRGNRGAVGLAALVLVLSLGLNVWLTVPAPTAAFYWPVTRFWELMAGAIIAIRQSDRTSSLAPLASGRRAAMDDGLAIAGLALLGLGLVLITPAVSFPGWWAVLPVTGAALLITAGPRNILARTVLGHPALVYVGLISYPLYLWHWPILAFARHIRLEPPNDTVTIIIVLASWLCADLTWRLVERPVRRRPTGRTTINAVLVLFAAGIGGLIVDLRGGFPSRFPPGVQEQLADPRPDALAAQRDGICLRGTADFPPECEFEGQAATGPRVVLWGDSHSASLYPGLKELALRDGFRVAQFTSSGCPPLPDFSSVERPNCANVTAAILDRIAALRPDLVIIAADWSRYDGSNRFGRIEQSMVSALADALRARGVSRVIAIGELPHWKMSPVRIRANAVRTAALQGGAPPAERNRALIEPKTPVVDAVMRGWFEAAGIAYVSPFESMCNVEGCLVVVPGSSAPTAFDQSHLSVAGSRFFAQALAPKLGLSR